MLENTRRYDIERVLWKAKPADLPKLAEPLARIANQFAEKIASVYVHEAFSAGSLDRRARSCPPPWTGVAPGDYVAAQFDGPMMHVPRRADGHLQRPEDRQARRPGGDDRPRQDSHRVIAAGSLAMALKKAAAELDGASSSTSGLAEDPAHRRQALLHSPRADRAGEADDRRGPAQGHRVRPAGRFRAPRRPVSARRSGRATSSSTSAPPPAACYRKDGRRFHRRPQGRPPGRPWSSTTACSACSRTRDSREARKKFIPQLKRMTDAGIKVYVGGGEGGTALEKVRPSRTGSPTASPPAARCSTPGQRAGALSGGAADGGRGTQD